MVVIRYVAVRIAVMYVGELVEYAERNELLRRPTPHILKSCIRLTPKNSGHRRQNRIPLKSSSPDPGNLPPGCVLQTRRHYTKEQCRQEEPPLREISASHSEACHLTEELNLSGI